MSTDRRLIQSLVRTIPWPATFQMSPKIDVDENSDRPGKPVITCKFNTNRLCQLPKRCRTSSRFPALIPLLFVPGSRRGTRRHTTESSGGEGKHPKGFLHKTCDKATSSTQTSEQPQPKMQNDPAEPAGTGFAARKNLTFALPYEAAQRL